MRSAMTVRTVRNEYAKMRHLRIELITALLLLGFARSLFCRP